MTEILENFVDEYTQEEDTETTHKSNPSLVSLISTLTLATWERLNEESNPPAASLEEVIFLTVKSTLEEPAILPPNTDITTVAFAYYLDVYTLVVNRPDQMSLPLDECYRQATLSLFDLYIHNHNEILLRRVLIIAAQSLHEVIASKCSSVEDVEIKLLINRLMNVALLTQTVKHYIGSFSKQRKKNLEYLSWLKTFLNKCLDNPSLEFVDTDPILVKVVPQVTNKAKTILMV